MPGTRPLLERLPVALEPAGPARRQSWGQACPTDLAGMSPPRGRGEAPSWEAELPPPPPTHPGPRPLLKPVQRLAALLSLLPPGSLSAMASALSYVSKFKSFVILFLTPILLLPLIILMPAKVSCVSGQHGGFREPGAPYGAPNPGPLGGAHGYAGGHDFPGVTHLLELRVLWEVPCEEF